MVNQRRVNKPKWLNVEQRSHTEQDIQSRRIADYQNQQADTTTHLTHSRILRVDLLLKDIPEESSRDLRQYKMRNNRN